MTEWFYNIKTGAVEEGRESLSADLDGPFASREDAANAQKIIADRARKWAEEDSRDN